MSPICNKVHMARWLLLAAGIMKKTLAAVMVSIASLTASLAGCATDELSEAEEGPIDGGDGKADAATQNVVWNKNIKYIVPRKMHDYMEKYQWGDYHLVFHMSRHWWTMGDQGRNWLKRMGETYANIQEGDNDSGLEFLVMHHAMIEHLSKRWGTLVVANNEDGYRNVKEMLKGWDTDEKVLKHITEVGGDPSRFKAAAAAVNADRFTSLDQLGLFVQTSTRITFDQTSPDSSVRFYTQDRTPGAGIHNSLHGVFQDSSSPINVGDPQTNLSNTRFWGIHGWIEAKYVDYLAKHPLVGEEKVKHDEMLNKYRLHMQMHSDYSDHKMKVVRASRSLAKAVGPKVFANVPNCADVDTDTISIDECL